MSPLPFKIYLIGDRNQTLGRPLSQTLREAGEAGIQAFQFREKDLSLGAQYRLALELSRIAKALGMLLFINGRIDLCLALGAAGVQLSVDGFPIGMARTVLGRNKRIALSCHNAKEVKWAEKQGADFALLGPVYDTPSKRRYGPPLGLDYFKQVKASTNIPLFAIGGINQTRLSEVFEAGADGVAMISDILSKKDVYRRCRDILQTVTKFNRR